MKKSNAEIILKALLSGHTIQIGELKSHSFSNRKIAMSEDYDLCFLSNKYHKDILVEEDVPIGTNMELRTFVKECERIPENEMFAIVASITLTEFKSSKR